MKKILLLLMTIACIGLTAGCAPSREQIQNAYYGPYPTDCEQLVREEVSRQLYDPYSAQFVFLNAPQMGFIITPLMKTEYGWRGEFTLNAKNLYGGYIGAKTLIYLIRDGKVISIMQIVNNSWGTKSLEPW